jgi:hypothetical protein
MSGLGHDAQERVAPDLPLRGLPNLCGGSVVLVQHGAGCS